MSKETLTEEDDRGRLMDYGERYGGLLEAITEEADAIAMKYFRSDRLHVERKDDGTAVTEADRAIEELARNKVARSGLELDVLGEEMGGQDAKAPSASGRPRLIIDPIDGTEEFTRGIPTFGTLLGVEWNGEIVAGVVSGPGIGARWWAYRGEGAYRNGKRIRVSSIDQLSNAMIFTSGTGPKKSKAAREKARRLVDASKSGRSFGGFWQHMLVAEGAVEVAVDLTSKPWDLAPLGIIVEEAGGRATNIKGERTIYSGEMVSTNGKLHDEVLRILK